MTTDTTSAPNAHAFDSRLRAYRLAKAKLDMHCAQYEADDYDDDVEAELGALSDAHTIAMDELLLTSAADQRDLWNKIDIIVREEIGDTWNVWTEIMALLRCDADRVLNRQRKPGEA